MEFINFMIGRGSSTLWCRRLSFSYTFLSFLWLAASTTDNDDNDDNWDDADDRITINRRCDVSSDLSLIELSSFCLSDTCMSSNLVLGWISYTSVDTCTSNPLSVVPMKFASVANIVKRYNRKMYVWNVWIFLQNMNTNFECIPQTRHTHSLCTRTDLYTCGHMLDRDTSLYSLVQSILVYKLWKKPQIDREILHLDYVEL